MTSQGKPIMKTIQFEKVNKIALWQAKGMAKKTGVFIIQQTCKPGKECDIFPAAECAHK